MLAALLRGFEPSFEPGALGSMVLLGFRGPLLGARRGLGLPERSLLFNGRAPQLLALDSPRRDQRLQPPSPDGQPRPGAHQVVLRFALRPQQFLPLPGQLAEPLLVMADPLLELLHLGHDRDVGHHLGAIAALGVIGPGIGIGILAGRSSSAISRTDMPLASMR